MSESQYVLLGMPDMNGSLRGKALSTDAFDSAVKEGTVMTDLLLSLDPVDTPIATYEGDTFNTTARSQALPLTVLSLADVIYRDGFEAGIVGCPVE